MNDDVDIRVRVWDVDTYQSGAWVSQLAASRPLVFALGMFAVWFDGRLTRMNRLDARCV